jgi:predicted transcriptional regulator of viral defense system
MVDNRQTVQSDYLKNFLDRNPVFTVSELDAFLSANRSGNINTRKASLNYYKSRGRILNIRRGLYVTVPRESINTNFQVDPYLLASRLASDAVLSHHTALELLGKSYTVTSSVTYTSETKIESFRHQEISYQRVNAPPGLQKKDAGDFGTTEVHRQGMDVKVTGFERTMVDVLSRPNLSGSWEEIWRSLESIEYFDLDTVREYLSLLDSKTNYAKVGFYLEQHRNELMVDEAYLDKLAERKPRSLHYIDRKKRKDCILVKRWNLLLPKELLERSWEEVL